MAVKEEAIVRLKRALEGDEGILLAYLFGSRVRGKSSPISDYDLAVLLKDSNLQAFAKVLSAASEALGVNEDKVDILDLARAPIYLKAKVLSEGLKIVDRGYGDALRLEVNIKHPEAAYQTSILLKKWLNDPDGLDLRVVKDRLDYLSQLNESLKAFFERRKPEDVSTDFEAWHALKSMVQDSVQAILDICAHIFSSKNLGVAESYRQYVEKLAEHKLMDDDLAEKLKLAIAIRNRLIHRYLTVKPQELWDFATKLSAAIIPEFKEWTLRSIRTYEKDQEDRSRGSQPVEG
ncbi:MAG: HepT-like ribonuclease domain-containing protein [Candidatus Bathyarchaeia archaeon]